MLFRSGKYPQEEVRRKFGAILLFCSYYGFLQCGIWYVRNVDFNEGGSSGFFFGVWCATMCAACSLTMGMLTGLDMLLSAN